MKQIKKRYININTDRFIVKTLSPRDACDSLANWLADAELMANMNKKPRKFFMRQVEEFISSYDQAKDLIVGVFTKEEKKLIGYYTIGIIPGDRRAYLTVLIGDRKYWGQRTVLETRAALLDYLFKSAHVDKVSGSPISRNFPAIFNYKAQGWSCEGTMKEHVVDANQPQKRLDIYFFGMLKSDWYKLNS
jgi:RimJ/RimL family protein N-acetyltransferase